MPSLLPPPPLADGRYQIGTPLGEGGMAVVWRGFDNALQIPCAVKILNQVFCRNEDLRARFLIEARTMARLRHPNIVSVQNLGEEDGCPYIVMEMLEGSVSALISASGPMPISLALEVTTQILRALELAHSQGVIHRDVKPANILFSSDRCFKLTDFGIARLRATDHSLTRTGVSLGTWGFMAPEQRKNSRHVDHRADLYAVGATLYALTVGSAPIDLFTADRDYTVLDDVSDILRPVIARATSYRPADRFADAAEMREALEAVRAQLEDEVLDYSFDLTPPPQLIPPAPDSDAEVAPDSDAEVAPDSDAEAAPDPPAPEEAPAAREEQEDDLPAAIFPDTTTGLDALLETPTPRRRQWLLTLAVAAAVMLLGVLTRPLWLSEPASEGIDLRDDAAAEDRATAAPPPEPEAPEPELTEPELTEPEVPAPELTEPELTEPEEAEPERPEPESRPAAPEPEPVAEAPEPTPVLKTGRITIRGDATSVRLKDDAGVLHSAGKLPPGSYVILAAFGDGEPFPAGTLALAEGQRLSVRCDSVFATCTVR